MTRIRSDSASSDISIGTNDGDIHSYTPDEVESLVDVYGPYVGLVIMALFAYFVPKMEPLTHGHGGATRGGSIEQFKGIKYGEILQDEMMKKIPHYTKILEQIYSKGHIFGNDDVLKISELQKLSKALIDYYIKHPDPIKKKGGKKSYKNRHQKTHKKR